MSENSNSGTDSRIVLFVVLAMLCGVVGGIVGYRSGVHDMKVRAVRQGYAEWYISSDADIEFRWMFIHHPQQDGWITFSMTND